MWIQNVKATPNRSSISSELLLNVQINYTPTAFLPINISGEIVAQDGIKLAQIYEKPTSGNQTSLIANNGQHEADATHYHYFGASLGERALEYIEEMRQSNTKKDIHLKLNILFKVLSTYLNATPSTQNIFHSISSKDMHLFSTETAELTTTVTISASDWVHDFLPAFGKGKYILLEMPSLEMNKSTSFIEEKVKKAIEAVPRMHKELLSGEWGEVIEKSRPIWELVNERALREDSSELKEYLTRSGFTLEANKHLLESIYHLFQFASKFIHKIGTGGKTVNPDIIASKEDANLVYSLCVNVVNLISTKINKLSN